MTKGKRGGLFGEIDRILRGLRTSHLAILMLLVFLLDLFWLDPVPFVDEILLAMFTILVARWRGRVAESAAPGDGKPPAKDVTARSSRRR
jgi:hypothetical protein